MMKNILTPFLTTFIVLSGFFAFSQQEYSSDKCNCSLTFPTDYEITTKEGEGYVTYKVKANVEDELYFFSYSVHSAEVPDSLVDVSVQSFNETLGGTITERETWKVKGGAKGKKVHIDLREQESKLIYCCLITNNIQYQLVYGNSKDKFDEKKAKKFIKTFKLKKK